MLAGETRTKERRLVDLTRPAPMALSSRVIQSTCEVSRLTTHSGQAAERSAEHLSIQNSRQAGRARDLPWRPIIVQICRVLRFALRSIVVLQLTCLSCGFALLPKSLKRS